MSYPLAIIAPHIGARSETFIQRHMNALAPGATVVIAQGADPPYAGHWDVDEPKLILNKMRRHTPLSLLVQQATKLTGLNIEVHNNREKHATKFLTEHGVTTILGEYLDFSQPYIKVALKLGIKLYAHAHGYDVSKQLRDQCWREKYKDYNKVNGIITMNTISRERLVALGIAEDKIWIVPYGIDVPQAGSARKSGERVCCLAVGRMVAKKAPLLLLDAFRQAAAENPNLYLDYIGEGPLLPAVRQYVEEFSLYKNVSLHEGQPNDVVKQYMRKADIFLQHSITDPDTGDEEGLPVAILEAMASGLPVISTIHAGIPDAVLDGKTGFLVEEGNTTEMAQRIVKLSINPQLRENFGHAAWERAKEYFSWQVERENLLQILEIKSSNTL